MSMIRIASATLALAAIIDLAGFPEPSSANVGGGRHAVITSAGTKAGQPTPTPVVEPPQSAPAVGRDSALEALAGSYVDDTGSPMVVKVIDGKLRLTSGPMTFTLFRTSGDRFRASERPLEIEFDQDRVSVSEAGKVVATATRGSPPPPVTAQGVALPYWLDANVPALLLRYHVPAAAIAKIDHGRISWTRVYGEQRKNEKATERTLFNVASLTKPITAEVLLRLASTRRLDLDAPMATTFIDPDLNKDARVSKLTVRMALQHRAGLPNWRSQTGNMLSFIDEPGARFHYAGEGYTYAARYAEKITGTPFEALAQRYLFAPLRMRDTYYTVSPQFARRVAYPHDAQGRELWPVLRLDFSGACCVHTTVGDYARFVATVMNDRQLDPVIARDRFALSPDRRVEMCDTSGGMAPEVCPPRIAMGLGWFVFGFNEETVIAHTGVNDGERSAAFFVPSRGVGYVILTNGANGAKLIRDVTAAAYDNPGYRRLTEFLAR